MSCPICGAYSCIRSFHSLEEQERYDARERMSYDVDILRRELQEAQQEITDLRAALKDRDAECYELSQQLENG